MEEIKHGYTRVTTPLSLFTDFSKIPPDVLHNACERGTKVHRYAELHMLGEYFPDPDEALLGYLNSFREWYDATVVKLISTEQRLYDHDLRVTGAIDIIAILKGDNTPTIIDIKTPASESKTWRLQTAMYRHLYNIQKDTKVKAERRLALRVKKNGSAASLDEYTDDNDLELYFSALKLWRYFNG